MFPLEFFQKSFFCCKVKDLLQRVDHNDKKQRWQRIPLAISSAVFNRRIGGHHLEGFEKMTLIIGQPSTPSIFGGSRACSLEWVGTPSGPSQKLLKCQAWKTGQRSWLYGIDARHIELTWSCRGCFFFLMKALWLLEINLFMWGARRIAMTFVMIFAKEWIKLMGLKSETASFAVLRMAKLEVRSWWKALAAFMTSTLIMSQHSLKKRPVKPSGPGALSEDIWLMAHLISVSVKLSASMSRLCGEICRRSQFRSICLCGGRFIIFWKCSWTTVDFSSCETAHPWSFRNLWMWFFLLLAFTLRWKYFALASPNLMLVTRDACLVLAISMTAKPRTRLLSFALRLNFANDKLLFSCATSKRKMTSSAICSFILASEQIPLLHFFKCCAVTRNLLYRTRKGSWWSVCSSHTFITTSLKAESLTQKFSKRNVLGRRGPLWLESRSGAWSDREVDRAWRTCKGNAESHSALQRNLSSFINVGWRLSLLHVNLRFWRCISWSSHSFRASRNCRIRLRFSLILFLSCKLNWNHQGLATMYCSLAWFLLVPLGTFDVLGI